MHYDKAKARLSMLTNGTTEHETYELVTILTQALETLEIIERMVHDLNREVKTLKSHNNQGGIQ